MDALRPDLQERIGSVKAALQLFGERSRRGEAFSYMDGGQFSIPKDGTSIGLERKDTVQTRDRKGSVESEISRLRLELSDARKVAKPLALQVEESKSRAKARKQELEMLKSDKEGSVLANGDMDHHVYTKVVKDLETEKGEVRSIKLGIGAVLGEKVKADEETKIAHLRLRSSRKSIEELGKEIDQVDEECVLVELARIEAIKESRELESQRKLEAARYSQKLREVKAKIAELKKKASHAKKLEQKLFATTSDIDALQSEMMFVRAMEKNSSYKSSVEQSGRNNESGSQNMQLLQASQADLEAAKKQLATVKEGGFKYVAFIDSIREKMQRISSKASRLRKLEEDTDKKVQDLNTKLLKANYDLEVALNSERKIQAIKSNLSAAISNMQNDIENAGKEKEDTVKGTEQLKSEILRNNSVVDLAKDALLTATRELELIKASEAAALDKLQTFSERTMKYRAVSSQNKSTITIPNFELEYLRNCAAVAGEIADSKVEAAQLWIESFVTSEKEALLQVEWTRRKLQELEDYEEEAHCHEEKKESTVEIKVNHRRSHVGREHQTEESQHEWSPPRESLRENGISNSRRTSLQRRSITLNSQTPGRTPSVTLRRRRKLMRNLAQLLGGRKVEAHELAV